MTKDDMRILHIYYIVEIFLFLIIKAVELILGASGKADPGAPGSLLATLRYCAIACNFLMMAYLYVRCGLSFKIQDNLIPLAFALTLTADTFMCVITNARPMGYLFFTLVETVYMIYMKPTWKGVSARLALYAIVLLALWHKKMLTLDNALAMANIVQLTVNLFCAWIQNARVKSRETLLFALGITLFSGCDYSILIRTLVPESAQPLHGIAAFMVWTCYIPSQVLLLNSYVEKIRQKAARA